MTGSWTLVFDGGPAAIEYHMARTAHGSTVSSLVIRNLGWTMPGPVVAGVLSVALKRVTGAL